MMRKKRLFQSIAAGLLSALLLCLSLTPAFAAWSDEDFAAAQNLLNNPDFEQGFDYWTVSGNCSLVAGHEGGNSAKLPGGEGNSLQQTIFFHSPGDYVLKGSFLRESGSSSASCTIQIFLEDQPLEFNIEPDASWRKASFSFTIPSGSTQFINLKLTSSTPVGNVCVDDLTLVSQTNLPDAPTPAPEENLVPNPGFEGGVDGWNAFIGNPSLTQSDVARSGSQSLCVSGSTKMNSVASYSIETPLPQGEYEVSGWLRMTYYAPDQTPVLLSMTLLGPNVNSNNLLGAGAGVPVPYDGTWYPFSFTMELDETTSLMLLVGATSKAGVNFCVDDVSIAPVNREAEPSTPNLLQNPGFEAGLDGWEVKGAGGIFTTDEVAYVGKQSAWFNYFQPGAMETYLTQTVAVASPGSYTFSASILPDGTLTGAGAILFLEARDESGAVLASAASPFVSAPLIPWKKTKATLSVPPGTAFLTVKLGGAYCTGAFYADQLRLQKDAD